MTNENVFKIQNKAYEVAQNDIDKILAKNNIKYLVDEYAKYKTGFAKELDRVNKISGLGNDKEEYNYYYFKYMESGLGDILCNYMLSTYGYEVNGGICKKKRK